MTHAPADKLAALATAMRHFIAKPDTNGPEWLTFLEAIDAVDNTAIAQAAIDNLRYDLGETEVACLACGQSDCPCDLRHDDCSSLTYVERVSPTAVMA